MQHCWLVLPAVPAHTHSLMLTVYTHALNADEPALYTKPALEMPTVSTQCDLWQATQPTPHPCTAACAYILQYIQLTLELRTACCCLTRRLQYH